MPSQSQRPGGPNREKARNVEGRAMEQQELYRYYSTQRPVDIGTYPKDPDNPLTGFLNYDERTSVEHGAFRAWGEVIYRSPLPRIKYISMNCGHPGITPMCAGQWRSRPRWWAPGRCGIISRRADAWPSMSIPVSLSRASASPRRRLPDNTGWPKTIPLFTPAACGLKSPLKLREDNRRTLCITSTQARNGSKPWKF